MACQREKAGVVSIARACTPVFSFIWQVTIFHSVPDWYSLLGDFIIMCSIFGLAAKKILNDTTDQRRQSKEDISPPPTLRQVSIEQDQSLTLLTTDDFASTEVTLDDSLLQASPPSRTV